MNKLWYQSWTTLFYLLSRKLAILTRHPILSGLIYGGVIYLVMNFVVLPASSVPHPKSTATIAAMVNGVLALLLCIGLPVSVFTSRYLRGALSRLTVFGTFSLAIMVRRSPR
jgi:hypothetical protein